MKEEKIRTQGKSKKDNITKSQGNTDKVQPNSRIMTHYIIIHEKHWTEVVAIDTVNPLNYQNRFGQESATTELQTAVPDVVTV